LAQLASEGGVASNRIGRQGKPWSLMSKSTPKNETYILNTLKKDLLAKKIAKCPKKQKKGQCEEKNAAPFGKNDTENTTLDYSHERPWSLASGAAAGARRATGRPPSAAASTSASHGSWGKPYGWTPTASNGPWGRGADRRGQPPRAADSVSAPRVGDFLSIN